MKFSIVATSLLALLTAFEVAAQSPASDPRAVAVYRGLLNPGPAHNPPEPPGAAVRKQHEFWLQTEKFVNLWTSLAREYNENGTFNIKTAKQISKAFHDLEKTEGWPKSDRR